MVLAWLLVTAVFPMLLLMSVILAIQEDWGSKLAQVKEITRLNLEKPIKQNSG
jgi:hypothetical protein